MKGRKTNRLYIGKNVVKWGKKFDRDKIDNTRDHTNHIDKCSRPI